MEAAGGREVARSLLTINPEIEEGTFPFGEVPVPRGCTGVGIETMS